MATYFYNPPIVGILSHRKICGVRFRGTMKVQVIPDAGEISHHTTLYISCGAILTLIESPTRL